VNVSTRQIRAFLQIARLQSFTKAAEQVHISQAGLSMMVKELEEQLGSRLFDRTTRSVALTEAGRRFQPVAARVMEELTTVSATLGEVSERTVGTLRIAATPLVSASLLPSVFKSFAKSHPGVTLELVDAELGEVRRRVLEGEADIGLGFFFKPAAGVVRTPLFRFRLMRVSPPDGGRVGVEGSAPWSSLVHARLISLPHGNPIQSLIESHLKAIGRANEDRPVVNFFGTLIGMVEAGLGTAVIPSFALTDCLRHRVRVAMLTKPSAAIDLFCATRRGAGTKPIATDFAAALRHEIPSLVMHD
jgi:DNA-binding transcriptional LysR family regulator